ncbi:uncharacterized protein PGTG_02878 [Puccinia graminis f. sp. tritici CRL 75-36-700-3]|uniref:Uncharacterized protein n=1 Tax=Puccinia graminis f. sp. tritici (strain CRL 75-36-700-3 / race SCCL) TaxID=418459 RepID=E3JWL2_PUCGT|nr:uncharacterized protein PGTG_02878 [Puccinia graminis f. sp. tritici CRL 75-36-700-3]EFP76437.2 hypothetical protein PGTG_02878 [Puccinia graminis f. sp. tritici CRL 75-36-700-3]
MPNFPSSPTPIRDDKDVSTRQTELHATNNFINPSQLHHLTSSTNSWMAGFTLSVCT